jgi:hypothetical protein
VGTQPPVRASHRSNHFAFRALGDGQLAEITKLLLERLARRLRAKRVEKGAAPEAERGRREAAPASRA